MDLRPNRKSPVIADPVPVNRTRFGPSSNLNAYSPGLLLIAPKRRPGPLKVDDVRATGWLDVMKSSSPTDVNGAAAGVVESAYCSWLLKYPSAISSFNQLAKCAEGKQIALFLDYDGTLSPIVNNPDNAFMSHAMRAAVKHVAEYFPTAIISGRSRDKVYEFVGLTELYYAGSHGMDIMGPVRESDSDNEHSNSIRSTDKQGKEVNLFQPASKYIPIIDEVSNLLLKSVKGIKGATIENNKFCVSVHYRLVDEQDWVIVGQIVQDILKDYPELRLTYGRKVLEVRPMIDWNKGKAVEFLLDSLSLNNSDDVLPIYVGDDRTDEDAFQVLKEANRGFGILVSSAPKESSASYSLRDPTEVMHFLKSLVAWKTSTAK